MNISLLVLDIFGIGFYWTFGFPVFSYLSRAAKNICIQLFAQQFVFIYLVRCGCGMTGSQSRMAYKTCSYSTFLTTFSVVSLFNFRYFNNYVMESVVLISISVMKNHVEYLFMCLFPIHISYLINCSIFCLFLNVFLFYFLIIDI